MSFTISLVLPEQRSAGWRETRADFSTPQDWTLKKDERSEFNESGDRFRRHEIAVATTRGRTARFQIDSHDWSELVSLRGRRHELLQTSMDAARTKTLRVSQQLAAKLHRDPTARPVYETEVLGTVEGTPLKSIAFRLHLCSPDVRVLEECFALYCWVCTVTVIAGPKTLTDDDIYDEFRAAKEALANMLVAAASSDMRRP